MDIDSAIPASIGLAPDLGQNVSLADDLSDSISQEGQQVEFLWAEIDRFTAKHDFTGSPIDPERAQLNDWSGGIGLGSPQHRSNPSLKLRGRIRLDQVVVGAGIERGNYVLVTVTSRGHYDGDVRDRSQHSEQFGTVQVGQAEIENHQVGFASHDEFQSLQGCRRRLNMVTAIGQSVGGQPPNMRIVLDDNDRRHDRERRG